MNSVQLAELCVQIRAVASAEGSITADDLLRVIESVNDLGIDDPLDSTEHRLLVEFFFPSQLVCFMSVDALVEAFISSFETAQRAVAGDHILRPPC